MFRLIHILTPSNWPHAGEGCNPLPTSKVCKETSAQCQLHLWALVPLWWLLHLSQVLTLAMGEVLPRSHRATVPQAFCWDPVKSYHWRSYPKAHAQERARPECSRYARYPCPSKGMWNQEPSKRRGRVGNSSLKRKFSVHPFMFHIASSLGSLTRSSLTPTLCCYTVLWFPVSLNLLYHMMLTWLCLTLDFKLLEGNDYAALSHQVIFVDLLLYTKLFCRHWRLSSQQDR